MTELVSLPALTVFVLLSGWFLTCVLLVFGWCIVLKLRVSIA